MLSNLSRCLCDSRFSSRMKSRFKDEALDGYQAVGLSNFE
jgi:hypothetical protein